MNYQKVRFSELENLYHSSYGDAVRIETKHYKRLNLLLAVIVPIVYPLPLAIIINKLIPTQFTFRYEVKRK